MRTWYPAHVWPLHERYVHVGLWLACGQERLEQPHQCARHQKISAYNLNLTKRFWRSRRFSCTWNLMLLYLYCYFLCSERLSLTYSDREAFATGTRCVLQNCAFVLWNHIISHHLTAAATSPSTSICYSCRCHRPLLFHRGMPMVWIPVLVLFFFSVRCCDFGYYRKTDRAPPFLSSSQEGVL
jgi:hypothetical protein